MQNPNRKLLSQSGYVYILGAKGDDKGHYVISYQGKRDGENIWNAQDRDGRLFIQSIVGKAVELAGGEVATERYPWKNKGENSARMKIAKITYYEPWDWVIGAGVYEDELNTAAVQLDKGIKSMMSYISMMCLALVVIGGGLCMLLARGIAKPLQRIIEGLESGADQMASASGQVSSASQTLAEGASEQAASLEEASASLEQMSATTTQNAEHASKADTFMKEAIADINNADVSIRDLMGSMDEMSKASRETQNIVKTIDEIAFQTNLLALNAAIEAARAGEMGAGFAVVAEEVRNLATRAADAARDTAGLIEATVKKIEDGSDLLSRTNDAFGKVSESSVKTGELVSMISEASREQAQGIEETSVAVSEVDKVVQQNVANAEENAGAAEEINAQAEQMRGYVMELVSLVEGSSQKRERQKSGKGHFSLRLPNRSTGRDPKEQLGAGDWLSEDNVKLIAEN